MKKALLDSFIWRGLYFITALLLNVCIARLFKATQSGWIYFVSNNFYFVLLLGGLSLDSAITYFAASNKISTEKLASFSLTWPFFIMLFSIACTGILIHYNQLHTNYLFLFIAGACYTFGNGLTNFFTCLFYAKNSFAIPNIAMSIVNILVIASIPFFTWGKLFSLQDFLYLYFLQFTLQGVVLAILFIYLFSPVSLFTYPDKKESNALFRFALVALSANVAYYLINRVDFLFVEAFCSAKSLGNYVQVSKMGQLFLIIPSIISSAVYPQVAKGESGAIEKLILKMIFVFVVFYGVTIVLSFLFSNSIFMWLFGNTFDEMYIPFLILLPGILFLSLHIIIAAYFGGRNNPSYNALSTGMGLIIVLLGDYLLIKPMGITGAALVSTIGYAASFIVSLILFLKVTGNGLKDIITTDTFELKTYTSLFAKPPVNT